MSVYSDELWRSVADMSGLLLGEETLETTLRRISDLAVRSVEGCDAVGVTLCDGQRPATRAATGGLVYEVDNFQYEVGAGPCLQAQADRAVIAVTEMATETRWPQFAEHAAERGIHSSLSFPLVVRGQAIGALNLYATRADAFTAEGRETGTMFAAQAAVALSNAQTYAASVTLAEGLRQALDSRSVIDQAMGILIARGGCSQDGAFDELRTISQKQNRKLRVVAEEIVQTAREGAQAAKNPAAHNGQSEPGAWSAPSDTDRHAT